MNKLEHYQNQGNRYTFVYSRVFKVPEERASREYMDYVVKTYYSLPHTSVFECIDWDYVNEHMLSFTRWCETHYKEIKVDYSSKKNGK